MVRPNHRFGDKAHPNVYKTVFSIFCGFRCLENGRFVDGVSGQEL
jgi:hypothetical protein